MKILYGADAQVVEFVQKILPNCEMGFGECQALGVIDKDGKLVMGWIWHEYNPVHGIIEFSGASTSPKWMTRNILQQLFAYPFHEKVGCQMIVTRNSAKNTRLHRQLKRFGFNRIDFPRLYGREEDGVIWSLTQEQWQGSDFYVQAKGT